MNAREQIPPRICSLKEYRLDRKASTRLPVGATLTMPENSQERVEVLNHVILRSLCHRDKRVNGGNLLLKLLRISSSLRCLHGQLGECSKQLLFLRLLQSGEP